MKTWWSALMLLLPCMSPGFQEPSQSNRAVRNAQGPSGKLHKRAPGKDKPATVVTRLWIWGETSVQISGPIIVPNPTISLQICFFFPTEKQTHCVLHFIWHGTKSSQGLILNAMLGCPCILLLCASEAIPPRSWKFRACLRCLHWWRRMKAICLRLKGHKLSEISIAT